MLPPYKMIPPHEPLPPYQTLEFHLRPSTGVLMTFKDAIRKPFTFPGGYTIALYLSDNERICQQCARDCWKEICHDTIHGYDRQWEAGFAGIHWEGPDELCVQCNKPQPSEYGPVNKD